MIKSLQFSIFCGQQHAGLQSRAFRKVSAAKTLVPGNEMTETNAKIELEDIKENIRENVDRDTSLKVG